MHFKALLTNMKPTLAKAVTFLFFFCLLFGCNRAKKEKNCGAYKTGSFFQLRREAGEAVPFRIEREDSVQVETAQHTKDIGRYNIVWTDSCSYELRYVDGTYVFTPEQLQAKRAEVRRSRILETTALYCLTETKTGNTEAVKDTLWLRTESQ